MHRKLTYQYKSTEYILYLEQQNCTLKSKSNEDTQQHREYMLVLFIGMCKTILINLKALKMYPTSSP